MDGDDGSGTSGGAADCTVDDDVEDVDEAEEGKDAGELVETADEDDTADEDAEDGASNGAPTGLTPFVPLSLEQSHLEELDDALNQAMLSGDFVGLAVAVVRFCRRLS